MHRMLHGGEVGVSPGHSHKLLSIIKCGINARSALTLFMERSSK